MAVYLVDHPPATAQFRTSRGRNPTGAVVVHDSESPADFNPPDDGAERVAAFIATRTDPGSYHSISDSDGTVRLGEYGWMMYGEGTGGNAWALHLAAACRTIDWATNADWTHDTMWHMAAEARAMSAWMEHGYRITIPARRITNAEYRAGKPGFIPHADVDPTRRTDPNWNTAQWTQFLSFYSQGDIPLATPNPYIERMQKALNAAGVQPPLATDGQAGPKTAQALDDLLGFQQWRLGTMTTVLRDIAVKANGALTP